MVLATRAMPIPKAFWQAAHRAKANRHKLAFGGGLGRSVTHGTNFKQAGLAMPFIGI
jgi:hypothetical protein